MRTVTYIQILICCLFLSGFAAPFEAVAQETKTETTLLRELAASPEGVELLDILDALTRASTEPQMVTDYCHKLIKEAEKQNNAEYKCKALLQLITQAYNMYDAEEAGKWMQEMEPLARKNKFYDLFFRGKRCIIDLHMVNGAYELEEKESLKMLQDASDLHHTLGIVLAYQCLSNVYQITYREEKAIEMLEKAYPLSQELSTASSIEITFALIGIYSRRNDQKNWLRWIQKQDQYINEVTHRDAGQGSRLQGWKLMTNLSYLSYYTATNQFEAAEKYLKLSENNDMKSYGTIALRYHQSRYGYFDKIGQLDQALIEVDALIELFCSSAALSRNAMVYSKAVILNKLGRHDDALKIYQANSIERDSLQLALMNQQTEELKKNYVADQLRLHEERISRYNRLIFLLVAGIAICFLIYLCTHSYLIQKNLRKSESEMRKMAQEMEQGNVAKEKFLSTISTVIQKPLNIVVEGSLLLASDNTIDEQERRTISNRISRTSTELMQLINNILNHSRLEAGMMKFKEEPVDMLILMLTIVSLFIDTKKKNIKLNIPEKDSLLIKGDQIRLTEVLNNLFEDEESPEKGMDVEVKEEGSLLRIYVRGSQLSSGKSTQDTRLMNEVNRLIIEHFGGGYEIIAEGTPNSYVYFYLQQTKGKAQ